MLKDVAQHVPASRMEGALAGEHAGRPMSVEVNPLIVHEEGRSATAVDARLVLG